MKQESSAINPYNGVFGQQGWICPKCGRVYSPFTQMCLVTDRNDIVYINQLEEIKRILIESERYEDAAKISKCIEDEYSNLKRKIEDRE